MVDSIWPDILSFAIFIVVIIILYTIIIIIIDKYNQKTAGSTATINGLKVILRFILILIIALSAFSIFEQSDQFILSISSISGILIGFAATEVVGQVVSGLFLITTKPFDIEDLVKIGKFEGIVEEINLNYTILNQFDGTIVKIPNRKLLDTKFLNYTLKLDDEIRDHQGIEESEKKTPIVEIKTTNWFNKEFFEKMYDNFTDIISEKKITQYSFKIDLDFSFDPELLIGKLKKCCKKYTPIYNIKPKFAIIKLGWRPTVKFWILCDNPHIIVTNQNNFITDIAKEFYDKQEELA